MPVKVPKRKHFRTENGFSQSEQQMEKRRIPPIIQIQPYNEAKKVNLESTKKANILKCQHQGKKMLKKKSVPHGQIRKGKRVVKQIDDDQQAIHFQEQILVDILSRLPLRSLLRFKCVSKTWEALISDPYFHKMIMKQQLQSPDSNSQKLLIRKMFSKTAPSRETALLPPTEFSAMSTSFGLGYDDSVDGYKILKLDMCRQYPMEILTLKTGFWRKICNHPTAVCPRTTGYEIMEIRPRPSRHTPMEPLVYVHGAFHWIGHLIVPGSLYAVSFSISNEVYGDVPLLDEMGRIKSYHSDSGLSLLDGMLCYYTTNGSLGSFKLWAMKDYGVKESWIVLCTLQFNGLAIAKPRYRFPDGELLLYTRGELPHQCGVISSYTFQTSKGKFGFWPERGGSFEKGIV